MVLGEYEQRFNGKNRIALAKKIRKEFGKIIVLAKGFDKCIFGFSETFWNNFAKKEFEKPVLSDDGLKARRKMFAGAEEVQIDFQGRIVIPENLLRYAGIPSDDNAELAVIGAGDHLEVWDKQKWTEYAKSNF